MKHKNMSDLIEEYLKQLLEQQGQVEIQRSEIADYFDCVPSQINYVINTRFTVHHGYQVESKRGGGGYIRIYEVEISDDVDQIEQLLDLTQHPLSQAAAESMIDTLYQNKIVSLLEAKLMLAAMDENHLTTKESVNDIIRARILRSMLSQLLIKEKTD